MQRRAVLAEQPPQLSERLEVPAVGESRDAEGTPRPDVHQPAFGRVDGREGPSGVPARRAGVGAEGEDCCGDRVSRRSHDVHVARLSHAGSLRGNLQRLVPAACVDISPPQHGQAPAAGPPHTGSPKPLHSVLEQGDR